MGHKSSMAVFIVGGRLTEGCHVATIFLITLGHGRVQIFEYLTSDVSNGSFSLSLFVKSDRG